MKLHGLGMFWFLVVIALGKLAGIQSAEEKRKLRILFMIWYSLVSEAWVVMIVFRIEKEWFNVDMMNSDILRSS